MIQSTLSPVLGGIVLAALLAASMSTANSLVISIAGSCSRDFYNKVLNRNEKLNNLPFAKPLSRIVVGVSALLGIQIALHFEGFLKTMIVFATPYMASMLVALLGGLIWPRATAKAAYSAMVVGGFVGMIAFAVSVPGPFEGQFNADLALLIAWSLSTVVFVVVTLMTSSVVGKS